MLVDHQVAEICLIDSIFLIPHDGQAKKPSRSCHSGQVNENQAIGADSLAMTKQIQKIGKKATESAISRLVYTGYLASERLSYRKSDLTEQGYVHRVPTTTRCRCTTSREHSANMLGNFHVLPPLRWLLGPRYLTKEAQTRLLTPEVSDRGRTAAI